MNNRKRPHENQDDNYLNKHKLLQYGDSVCNVWLQSNSFLILNNIDIV